MLRACRRLLRPGGRIAFYTIFITPGLSKTDYRRAVQAAWPEVASGQEQEALLRSSGFVEIEETDVTAEYLRTARGWLETRERYAAELRKSEGESEFGQEQVEKREMVEAIEAGLLRRSLLVAKRSR